MALSEPFDILQGGVFWTTEFDFLWRQEQSRTARGRTIVKDFGSPLWALTVQSKQLSPNKLDYWRARLGALENGKWTFLGRPMSRCYPILYPNGTWPTGALFNGTATLASVSGDSKSITVSGLPNGYEFSIGDYLSIGDDLHRVEEDASAPAGTTGLFQVAPPIWPGVTSGSVVVKQPHCLMTINPGSVQSTANPQTGWGSVSFQATEAR
ncbi:hypothetical protein [Bradyrhizobium australafricanum]|uniref:hypothetical protein n=1 Tax=Bradyrhizobium australafricanum TaxID=2821406 RepID=UPI001CE3B0F1|nr:hypothetical protein [Bradyrhizobium australafricanum]MCA6098870.1 hypothetical protein [Bradyrhizobium australafricanum]